MTERLFTVRDTADLERCYPVMRELRSRLQREEFVSLYERAHAREGYEIIAAEDGGQVVAVMGYRLYTDFVRGTHLYIDDLVTTESARSRGFGARLLKYAEQLAKDSGCKSLRLCTGVENHGGIRFYEREGWTKRSFAYVKKVAECSL